MRGWGSETRGRCWLQVIFQGHYGATIVSRIIRRRGQLRRSPWLISAVVALGALGLGCNDDSLGGGTSGQIGNGTFEYRCYNQGDAVCSETAAIDSFRVGEELRRNGAIPVAVAVGGVFTLSYDPHGSVDDSHRIIPASSDDERSSGEFRIGQPAVAAFVAIETIDKASDYIEIEAREAVALQVWEGEALIGRLSSLTSGDRMDVTVVPVDDDETLLAGALPYRWETLNPGVVSISRFGASSGDEEVRNRGDVTLHAETPGVTKIRVASGDLGTEFLVEVK